MDYSNRTDTGHPTTRYTEIEASNALARLTSGSPGRAARERRRNPRLNRRSVNGQLSARCDGTVSCQLYFSYPRQALESRITHEPENRITALINGKRLSAIHKRNNFDHPVKCNSWGRP